MNCESIRLRVISLSRRSVPLTDFIDLGTGPDPCRVGEGGDGAGQSDSRNPVFMGKQVAGTGTDPDDNRPGLDLLRSLAGYPVRSVRLSARQVNSRIVEVHRDALGRVLGSTERLEETQLTDLDGHWLD